MIDLALGEKFSNSTPSSLTASVLVSSSLTARAVARNLVSPRQTRTTKTVDSLIVSPCLAEPYGTLR
jgi:hypothetical protein